MLHAKAHGRAHLDAESGDEGDDFVIKALEAGTAELAVRILAQGYEQIPQASISLTIVDPFVIVAADQYFEGDGFSWVSILPTSQFNYKLQYVLKQEDNGIEYADVPKGSTAYDWKLADSSKGRGSIDVQGVFQANLSAGLADIVVTDKKFPSNLA